MLTYDTTGGGRLVYISYQIWLSRNYLTFEAEVVHVHCVMERAYSLAKEYNRFGCVDTVSQLGVTPSSWGSLAALAVTRRVFFHFLGAPTLGVCQAQF